MRPVSRSPQFATFATVLLVLLMRVPAQANSEGVSWRFWDGADGMAESYASNITRTPSGKILVRHGDVVALNLLDGTRVTRIPEPQSLGRIYMDATGTFYSFDTRGLEILPAAGGESGKWKTEPIAPIAQFAPLRAFEHLHWFLYSSRAAVLSNERVAALPIAPGRVVILFPDRLLEWTRERGTRLIRQSSKSLGRFIDLDPSGTDALWVCGERGIGRLALRNGEYTWTEIEGPAGFDRFSHPSQGASGAIYTAARRKGGSAILSFQGGWHVDYRGVRPDLRGWGGLDGRIWLLQGDRLSYLESGVEHPVERDKSLSGTVLDINAESEGSFWVGTSQGVARYSAPLWRTPPGDPAGKNLVNALAKDVSGHLWLASDSKLSTLSGKDWKTIQLPDHAEQRGANTEAISPMDDGTIAVAVSDYAYFLIYHPATASFRKVRHPLGRNFGLIQKRSEGGLWVNTMRPGDAFSSIEIFRDGKFEPVPGLEHIPITDMRLILHDRNGALWIGGTDHLCRFAGGKLAIIGAKEGFSDTGVFGGLEAPDGTIYFGGRDKIISFDGRAYRTIRSGVDRARSFARTPDGTLWVATGAGVQRLREGNWITHGVEEGLPSSAAYKLLVDKDGHLWAGTTLGVARFHPEADVDPPLTSMTEERNLRDTPPDGQVQLNFWGMDKWKYTPQERLLFSYKLDDRPWSDFDAAPFASFHSLAGGPHRFYVRAMDRAGNIDPNPASYTFSVMLPWYLAKGFFAVTAFALLIVFLLVRVAFEYHANLKYQGRHDPLTGLPNRLAFEAALTAALERSQLCQTKLAVMFIDLDGFKQVNDLFGHKVGDLLLQQVGSQIEKCTRKGDTVARIGGDEFTIVLPDIDGRNEAAAIASRILSAIRSCSDVSVEGAQITGSIGIGIYPDQAQDAAILMRLADLAMYQSKARNKDCWLFFDPAMNQVDFRNSEMVGILRSAIDHEGFRLLFQPITDRTGKVIEFEALVRIHHPVLGVIPPSEFIAVAEETGLIRPLGKWVLRAACKQLHEWRGTGECVRIAINVSPNQLDDPDYAESVLAELRTWGLPPESLTIEITETVMRSDRAEPGLHLKRLRSAGVNVALDDFGTGYSALSNLNTLPLDTVKLDQSFIRQMEASGRTVALVADTIHMAQKLGFSVTAEGVETSEQLAVLRDLGCDHFQGYLLSPPLEAADAAETIHQFEGQFVGTGAVTRS